MRFSDHRAAFEQMFLGWWAVSKPGSDTEGTLRYLDRSPAA